MGIESEGFVIRVEDTNKIDPKDIGKSTELARLWKEDFHKDVHLETLKKGDVVSFLDRNGNASPEKHRVVSDVYLSDLANAGLYSHTISTERLLSAEEIALLRKPLTIGSVVVEESARGMELRVASQTQSFCWFDHAACDALAKWLANAKETPSGD